MKINYCKTLNCKYKGDKLCHNIELSSKLGYTIKHVSTEDVISGMRFSAIFNQYCPHAKKILGILQIVK